MFMMRSTAADRGARADSYAAMLDMVAWAETRGGVAAILSCIGQGIPLALQRLLGGLPPDVAWRYLETAAWAGVAG